MDPGHVVRVAQARLLHHVQKQSGESVDRIAAVRVHASYGCRLGHEVSAVILACPAGEQEQVFRSLCGEAQEKLQRLLGSDFAPGYVLLVEGQQVLVDTAQGHGRVQPLQAYGHVSDPQRLERLLEAARRLAGDLSQDPGDLLELCFPDGAGFSCGTPLCLGGKASGIVHQGIADDAAGGCEIAAPVLHRLEKSRNAEVQHLFVIGQEVPDAARFVDEIGTRTELLPDISEHPESVAGECPEIHVSEEPVRNDPEQDPHPVRP